MSLGPPHLPTQASQQLYVQGSVITILLLFSIISEEPGVQRSESHAQGGIFIKQQSQCSGFPGGASGKNQPASAGDTRDAGSIPGSGRSPGVRTDNLVRYYGIFHEPRNLPANIPWGWSEM